MQYLTLNIFPEEFYNYQKSVNCYVNFFSEHQMFLLNSLQFLEVLHFLYNENSSAFPAAYRRWKCS